MAETLFDKVNENLFRIRRVEKCLQRKYFLSIIMNIEIVKLFFGQTPINFGGEKMTQQKQAYHLLIINYATEIKFLFINT